jgi:tetratricopeptide (TPR) repeat protein
VPEHLSLCPGCGLNVDETQPIKRRKARKAKRATVLDETLPLQIPHEQRASRRPALWQRTRIALLTLAIFLGLLIVSATIGVYTGARQGRMDQTATAETAADEYYRAGLDHLDAGEFELAIEEFERALELNPGHPLAEQARAEAQTRLAALPTPTIQATEDLVPQLYEQGRAAYEGEDWEGAIRALSQLRALDSDYQGAEVEDMLFASLVNQGMALLNENPPRFEQGIFYLDQAQEIQPLDQEALWEREIAHRYLTALGYWGVDWRRCIQRLEELYELAPGYHDVLTRLFQVHILYGDLLADQGEMCPAAAQYARALELMNDAEVEEKRDEAAEVCAEATPTPIPPITGTLPTTGTVVAPGFEAGRLAYPAYNSQTGLYDIYTLIAGGHLTRVASGADQPSWQWGSDRLIYRNRISPSLSLIQPGGQPVVLQAEAGAASPTLSPDGSRYAYASEDGYIYMARVDGAGEPEIHASGWGPAWGPTGLLAWTGCEADRSACGIFVDNPDDSEPPRRLTASRSDTALHWHPSGEFLAYMSDFGGNWSLYRLGVSGDVQVLTDAPTIEALPAWAPDGSALAFLSYRDGRWGIYRMDADGENMRQIIDLGTEMPLWQNQRLSWAR